MKVYNLNELTDSRVLYDKNPPKFMIYIIALVTVLLVMFFVWANKSAKTYMVKGQGIVTTENKSQIMAAVFGAVVNVNALEGKEVKDGYVLFTLNPVEPNLQSGQAEYDTIKGKVLNIDGDATIDREKGNVYFKVKVKLN